MSFHQAEVVRARKTRQPPHPKQIGQRCEHKLRYRTHARAVSFVVVNFERGFELQFVYRCPWCEGWHATSHSKKHSPKYRLLAGVVPRVKVPVHDHAGETA